MSVADTGFWKTAETDLAFLQKLFVVEDGEKKQIAHTECRGNSTQTKGFTSLCKNTHPT